MTYIGANTPFKGVSANELLQEIPDAPDGVPLYDASSRFGTSKRNLIKGAE
jgi:hypothetical protein